MKTFLLLVFVISGVYHPTWRIEQYSTIAECRAAQKNETAVWHSALDPVKYKNSQVTIVCVEGLK